MRAQMFGIEQRLAMNLLFSARHGWMKSVPNNCFVSSLGLDRLVERRSKRSLTPPLVAKGIECLKLLQGSVLEVLRSP